MQDPSCILIHILLILWGIINIFEFTYKHLFNGAERNLIHVLHKTTEPASIRSNVRDTFRAPGLHAINLFFPVQALIVKLRWAVVDDPAVRLRIRKKETVSR